MYSLYHYHKFVCNNFLTPTSVKLTNLNKSISSTLSNVFNNNNKLLSNSKFLLTNVSENHFQNLSDNFHDITIPFLIPAERSGLHLFYHELNTNQTSCLSYACC